MIMDDIDRIVMSALAHIKRVRASGRMDVSRGKAKRNHGKRHGVNRARALILRKKRRQRGLSER